MAKIILTTGGIPTATTANVTQYWPLAVTSIEAPATIEANKQIIHRSAGTLSKLYVKVTANTINGTSTINVRKNGVNAGLSLTIGPNATGPFENTTNTISVAAGDKLNYQTVPGAATGTMSISIFSVLSEATNTNETVTRLTISGAVSNYTTASVSRYNVIAGNQASSNGSEIASKCKIRKNGTGRNLAVYISANARTTDTVIRTRVNANNGACVITIPAGDTGWFEDIANSDTLAVGDDYALVTVTGTGTEIMTMQSVSLDFVTSSGWGMTMNARNATFNVNAASTHYFPIGGALNAGTTELGAQQKTRIPAQFSELIVHALNNLVSAESTVRLRKNGVDTSIGTIIPANTSGYFTDLVNTESFTETDEISIQIIVGGIGTTTSLKSISLSSSETVAPITVVGSAGRSQGRSPLYKTRTRPRDPEIAAAVIVRVKIALEYEVEKLSVQIPLRFTIQRPRPIVKYASAILTPIAHILPLPVRPTPPLPTIVKVRLTLPLGYEVTTLRPQLKAGCSYEVDKLITQEQQNKLRILAVNFLASNSNSDL